MYLFVFNVVSEKDREKSRIIHNPKGSVLLAGDTACGYNMTREMFLLTSIPSPLTNPRCLCAIRRTFKLLYQVAPYIFMNAVCGLRAVNEGLCFCVVN